MTKWSFLESDLPNSFQGNSPKTFSSINNLSITQKSQWAVLVLFPFFFLTASISIQQRVVEFQIKAYAFDWSAAWISAPLAMGYIYSMELPWLSQHRCLTTIVWIHQLLPTVLNVSVNATSCTYFGISAGCFMIWQIILYHYPFIEWIQNATLRILF